MTRLPRDIAFTDYPANVSRPASPALYYGVRMDLGSANGFGEAVPVRLDQFAPDGVLFVNPNASVTVPLVGTWTPAIEDLDREVDVQAWVEWRSLLGQVQTNEVRKIGVFARADLASPALSGSGSVYAAFQDVSTAVLFYAQGLGTPGTFRFKLARYDGTSNVEIQLAATAALLEYDDSLKKPMGMRLVAVDDDLAEVTLRAQVRATAFEQPLQQTSALAGSGSTTALGVEVGEVGDGRALARLSRNVMHGALPWVSESAAGAKNLVDNGSTVNVDADSMPTALEAGQRLATALLRNHLTAGYDGSPLASYRAGTYHLAWDGGPANWEVADDGASLVSTGPNRASFTVTTPSASGVHLALTALTSANPPKAIRVWHDDNAEPSVTDTFDPAAVADLADLPRLLRFADALKVETNEAEDFADLPGDGALFWGDAAGMPIGQVIALCNAYQRDCWLAMPALLSSAARQSVLERFRDELSLDLMFHVERGHEPWSPAYVEDTPTNPGVFIPVAGSTVPARAAWIEGNDASPDGAVTDGQVIGTPLDADPDTAQRLASGARANALFDDAAAVFQGTDLERLRFVVSSQASDTDATDDVLSLATRATTVSIAAQVPDRDAAMVDLTQSAADIVADLVTEATATASLVAAQRAKVRDDHGLELACHALGVRLLPTDATELGNALDATLHADAEAMIEGLLGDWQSESDNGVAIADCGHLFGSVADGVRGLRRFVGQAASAAKLAKGFEDVAVNEYATGDDAAPQLFASTSAQATPGYQVIEADDWTTIFEVTVTGSNYPTGVDACGAFGDYVNVSGGGAVFGGFCTRLAVYDPDTGARYWEDEWTERIESLCRARSILGIANGRDYSSSFPGDISGYGLERTAPYLLTYDSSGEGVQHANADHPGFELYQRKPDDPKSQHRRGTFLFDGTSPDGAVGIVLRATHFAAVVDPTGVGAFLHYRCVVTLSGATFTGEVWRRGLDDATTKLATFDASSLSAGTEFTLSFQTYDQLTDGSDGPAVMTAALNGTPVSFVLEDVAGISTIGTSQTLIDRSGARLLGGYEGLFLFGSTAVRACREFEQLTLTNEQEKPIEDVTGLVFDSEATGATQTVDLPGSWGATRRTVARSAVTVQRSGRSRRLSLQPRVRDVWTMTGVVTKTQRNNLRAKFEQLGSATPFTFRGPDAITALPSRPVLYLLNSFRSIRVPSQKGDERYRVEFVIAETFNG